MIKTEADYEKEWKERGLIETPDVDNESIWSKMDAALAEIDKQHNPRPEGSITVTEYGEKIKLGPSASERRLLRLCTAGKMTRIKQGNKFYYKWVAD